MAQNTISQTWSEAEFRISSQDAKPSIEMAYLTIGNLEWMAAGATSFYSWNARRS